LVVSSIWVFPGVGGLGWGGKRVPQKMLSVGFLGTVWSKRLGVDIHVQVGDHGAFDRDLQM
ncbi:MAG: hypothetical protein ACXABY_26940, partial [Candidatus Thorarchaeota archaeon]